MPELTQVTFEHVTFLPCRHERTSRTGFAFGVYGVDGRHLNAFDHPWCALLEPERADRKLSSPAIYGGMLMNHLGHFLMEAMSRLWFIHAHPELPIVWHWIDLPVPHTVWPGWMDEAWTLLGLSPRRQHVIRETIAVDEVILPQSGLLSSEELHPLQASALARCDGPVGSSLGRVWLSRHGLPSQFGRLKREDELESSLAAKGWSIVRPETLSVAAKANLFAGAEIIAGFAGSIFHAVVLTAKPTARLLILDRPSVDRSYYRAVGRARALKQGFLTVPMETVGHGPLNGWTSFRLLDPLLAAEAVAEAAERVYETDGD